MTLGTGGSPGVNMVDATHEVGGGVGWGGDDNVLCTCTHGWCYATSCFLHLHTWLVLRNIMFLALAHMVGATQHHGVGWGGDDNILCTCTHGWCYATPCFLHLHTWSVLRNIMFLALAHMVGATQHHVSCTCTHGRCYATSCFLHLHTWSVLRNIMFWHRYLLSSHFLNKAPGLARIMQALRCHKMKCMSGLASPTDAFKKPLWQLWLTCSKKKGWLSCC